MSKASALALDAALERYVQAVQEAVYCTAPLAKRFRWSEAERVEIKAALLGVVRLVVQHEVFEK